MLRRAILASTVLGCLAAASASQTAPVDPAALPPIGQPAPPPDDAPPHLQLIDRDDLRRHAYWLADDERKGRYTSSAGQQATVEYIAAHFKQLGLKPLGDKKGYLQHYPLQATYLHKSTQLSFGKHKIADGFAVLPVDDDDKESLSGAFVWCGNGTTDDLPSIGRRQIPLVVLHGIREGGGTGNDLRAVNRYRAIATKLANMGARAALICLLDDNTPAGNTLSYHALLPDHPRLQYGSSKKQGVVRIPLFIIGRERSRALFEHVGIELDDQGGPKTAPKKTKATGKLTIRVAVDAKSGADNVCAVLEGKSKEAVVFSAHHDHIGYRVDGDSFNGADDNASGTAGLLEIAEAFAKGGEPPQRSIIFLSVSGEELGLWGSAWWADHPTWPLGRIVANINIDMIGRAGGTDDAIAMQVTPSHAHAKYSTMVRDAVALGAKFGIEWSSGDQYYARSDHYNFAQKGIPVVFFCDGEHPDYHQVSDHADKLHYGRMEAVARLAFWTGWNVANAKGRPQQLGSQANW